MVGAVASLFDESDVSFGIAGDNTLIIRLGDSGHTPLGWVMSGRRLSKPMVKTSFLILMLRQRDPVVAPVDFWGLPWLCVDPEDHDSLRPLLAVEENPCTV